MRKPAALVTHKEIPVQEAHLFQGNTYLRAMKAKNIKLLQGLTACHLHLVGTNVLFIGVLRVRQLCSVPFDQEVNIEQNHDTQRQFRKHHLQQQCWLHTGLLHIVKHIYNECCEVKERPLILTDKTRPIYLQVKLGCFYHSSLINDTSIVIKFLW